MSATSFANAIALAAVMAAGVGVAGASAQDLPIPAEFPPSSYTGTQFVDSKGCAFVRAGMDGAVSWIPRVDRARNQLCNFKPTATTRTASAPSRDIAPDVPIITVDAQPAPVAPRAAPAAPRVTPPAASRVAAAPRVQAPRPAAPAPAPVRVAAAPSPRVVVPAPVAAPAPRRITLAEACEGRTGVQPGFISARTRQPIDCGGVTRVAAAAPAAPMTTMRPARPEPLRLTLAAACAQQAQTGRTLINAATGRPIACVDPAPVVVAQVPAVQPTPRIASACGIDGLASNGRYPVRCGPQALSPSGGVQVARAANTLTGTGSVATVSTRSVQSPPLFGAGPVPASNAPVAVAQATVPRGYTRVWDDGRINPRRGVTQPQVQVAARVSSRSVAPAAVQAPAAASGHRYVQVGSFGDPANAARLIARLQAAGLPVASAKSGSLKVIAAGPFRSPTDLNQALNIVRGMGFADAYLRS